MRLPISVLLLSLGFSHTVMAAPAKFQPLHKYDNDYSGNGLYPKGFAVKIKGKTATLTNLADHRKFTAKFDPKYKARDARFNGYTLFRGQFEVDKYNVEDREVLVKLNGLTKNRAYVRFHGDQWGGVEIFTPQK